MCFTVRESARVTDTAAQRKSHIHTAHTHIHTIPDIYAKKELYFSMVMRKEDTSDTHCRSIIRSSTWNEDHSDTGKLLPITGSKL